MKSVREGGLGGMEGVRNGGREGGRGQVSLSPEVERGL